MGGLASRASATQFLRLVAGSWRKHWVAVILVLISLSAVFDGGFFSGAGDPSNLAWGALLCLAAVWLWRGRSPDRHPLRWPGVTGHQQPAGGSEAPNSSDTEFSFSPWLPGQEPWLRTADEPVAVPAPSRRQRRASGPRLGRRVWAGWLIGLGLAVAGDRAGWYSLSVAEALAVLLAVVGAALVFGAFRGGGRWLLPLAVLLGAFVILAGRFDRPDAFGETTVTGPAAWAGVDRAAGRLIVDLRSFEFATGSGRVEINLGVGEVQVLVPDDVDLVVQAFVGLGELDIVGQRSSGADLDKTWRSDVDNEVHTVEIEVNVALGSLVVTRAGALK